MNIKRYKMTQLQRDKTLFASNENVWPLVPPGRSNADMMER